MPTARSTKPASATNAAGTTDAKSVDTALDEGQVPATVADDTGQATVQMVPASKAAGTVPQVAVATARYATTEGKDAGNTAAQDYYLDDKTGKVVNSQPERGTLIASRGSVLTPAAARMLAEHSE